MPRILRRDFKIADAGLPAGADKRFVLRNKKIAEITRGLTDAVWLFCDIKSVGPRDDFDHAVMSPNQISGDGIWKSVKKGVNNSVMQAAGKNSKHAFYCSVPPVYVLSDGAVLPVILVVIKPVYDMLSLNDKKEGGQPLKRITVAAIPGGLLLTVNPGYLKQYPNLLFPGKDDKRKNKLKVRGRVSFDILRQIAPWRVEDVTG